MVSFKRRAGAVTAVSLVAVLLQGCNNSSSNGKGPKECEGAEGVVMETCKKCVEEANKNSDQKMKDLALQVCADVVKGTVGTTTTQATAPNNAGTTAPNNGGDQQPQTVTTAPNNGGGQQPQNTNVNVQESVQQATTTQKTVDTLPLTEPTEKLVACTEPCNVGGGGLAEVTENILGSAAKASLHAASSAVQTSAPLELKASPRSAGRSVGSARARQKMADRAMMGTSAGQDHLFNGIKSQPAVKASQVMQVANAGQENFFNELAVETSRVLSGANTGQDSSFDRHKFQQTDTAAQVTSGASTGQDSPNIVESQTAANTAQVRSVASAGQNNPHNFIKPQPVANRAQVDDEVTSDPGNVPNNAESHPQKKPTQTKAAVVETEASARARAEAEAEAAQARAGAAAEAQLTQSQQEATSAQATDHVVSASMDNSHHSTEPQRRENVVEGTDLISSGFSANSDDSHRIAEHQLLSNAMEATDPVSSAVSANVDTLHHSVESQLQANAGGATDPESNGVSNIMDTWHNSVKPELQANAAEVDRLAAATRGAQATQPALQNGPANGALFDFVHGKKTTNDAEVDVRAATAQAAVPVLQRGPVNEGPANAVEQKSADPGAIAEITAQPWPPSDKSYNTGGNSARLQNQLMVDRQKQVASTARGSVVHLHKGSQEEKEGPNFNKAENSARAPNKDSFQTVVGTSGKVAHVGRPRHGARGARKR